MRPALLLAALALTGCRDGKPPTVPPVEPPPGPTLCLVTTQGEQTWEDPAWVAVVTAPGQLLVILRDGGAFVTREEFVSLQVRGKLRCQPPLGMEWRAGCFEARQSGQGTLVAGEWADVVLTGGDAT